MYVNEHFRIFQEMYELINNGQTDELLMARRNVPVRQGAIMQLVLANPHPNLINVHTSSPNEIITTYYPTGDL